MKHSDKIKPVFFVFGIVFAMLICAILWFSVFALIVDLRPLHRNVVVNVKKGETVKQLSNNLYDLHLIPDPNYFKYFVKMSDATHYLQTGYYHLTPDMSVKNLLYKIDHGQNEHYQIKIIPGEAFVNLEQQIHKTPLRIKIKYGRNMEGVFWPDTYDYYDKGSLFSVFRKAHVKMHVYLAHAWKNRDKNLPYQNQFRALTMASILEKESANYQDQRHIAGVFINRLNKHMYLGSNATVRYAVFAKPGVPLKHKDFKSKNYFNTYRYKGLPPTPISYVGKQAIQAAMHPLKTDDLYYLTTEQGKTIFSPQPIHQHLSSESKYVKK